MGPQRRTKWTKLGPKGCPKSQDERKSKEMKNIEKPFVFVGFSRFWDSQLGLFWGQDGSVEVQVASCWGMLARFGSFWTSLEALGVHLGDVGAISGGLAPNMGCQLRG